MSREKQQGNTTGSSWPWIVAIGISLNRIRYDLGLIFPSVPSRWVIRVTEFHFPTEIEDLQGNCRACFLRRWRISEKFLKISDCTLCLWITLIHSEHSGLFLNKGFRALLWNNYESPKEQSRRNSNRTFRLTRRTDQWEFRCSVFTVLQLSVSVQTSWLNRHVFHVHSWSQSLKTYHTLILVQLTFSNCMLSWFSIFHFRHVELQPCHKMCFLIAGEHSRQAAKAPPPRAPAAVVPTLRPKSEVRPPLPITDGTASFDPPRRPPGPMSVVLEGVQKIGRPPAAPRSLAPLQRPPLRSSRSSWSRRPRQTRSRSDSRARSRSPGPSVSEVRSEARSLQQAHHTYPPGDWETSLGVFDIYGLRSQRPISRKTSTAATTTPSGGATDRS